MMKPNQQQNKNLKKQNKSLQGSQPPNSRGQIGNGTQSGSQQQPLQLQQLNRVSTKTDRNDVFEVKEVRQLDSQQEAMISLIQEYLLRYNLVSTLDVLQKEIMIQGPSDDDSCLFEILKQFENGNQEKFFALWNQYLPINIRMRDQYAKYLEFYIQIYFLIYEINPHTSRQMNGLMQKHTVAFFKTYLDTKGQELSKTTEFLQFYALPYVQRPQDHQSYRHLFTQQWVVDLRIKLTSFLQDLTSKDQQTLLEQMYDQFSREEQPAPPQKSVINMSQSNNQNYTIQLEVNNQELLGVIQDYNLKYNQMQKKFKEFIDQRKGSMMEAQQKWHQKGKEIVALSQDLVKVISSQGIPTIDIEIYKRKIEKYEKFFSTSEQDIITQSKALTQQENHFENELSISPIPQAMKEIQFDFEKSYMSDQQVQLDFMKLHHLFMSQTYPDTLCRVLQALRWRITKAKGASQRREVLIQYAQYDIIGCNPKNTILMQRLLVDSTDQVKEFFLRLVNAMASDYQGRSYLMDSFHLVKTLIDILKRENGDTLIRRNSLGALQKLSLRRKPQIIMIENELIRWIIKALKNEKDTLCEYSYEYITALFMNLSMRERGKHRCEDPKEGVLQVLVDLLKHENIQVQTFVNGTLYSLFSKQSLREQARSIGLVKILQTSMQSSDERFTKQIEYIIVQLNSNKPDESQQEDDNDFDDIDDIDDNEDVDDEEEAENNLETQGIKGEELLRDYFALSPQEAQMQINLTKSIMMDNKSKRELLNQPQKQNPHTDMPFRPATPTMTISQMTKQISPPPIAAQPESKLRNQIARAQLVAERHQDFQLEEQKLSDSMVQQLQQYGQRNEVAPISYLKHPVSTEKTEEEHKIAFETRTKVVRSPPQNQIQNQNQVQHQYLKRK